MPSEHQSANQAHEQYVRDDNLSGRVQIGGSWPHKLFKLISSHLGFISHNGVAACKDLTNSAELETIISIQTQSAIAVLILSCFEVSIP